MNYFWANGTTVRRDPNGWNNVVFWSGGQWYLGPGFIGLTAYPYKHGSPFFLEVWFEKISK
jgi:hypothetical protein